MAASSRKNPKCSQSWALNAESAKGWMRVSSKKALTLNLRNSAREVNAFRSQPPRSPFHPPQEMKQACEQPLGMCFTTSVARSTNEVTCIFQYLKLSLCRFYFRVGVSEVYNTHPHSPFPLSWTVEIS